MPNSAWYCLTTAFFGSVKTRIMAPRSSGRRAETTGSRPTNSGIMPKWRMSSLVTCCKRSPSSSWSWPTPSWVKPMVRFPSRRPMMSSSPTNVPPQMNRMLLRVHLDVLLLGMLAAALGRDVGDRPFEHLQQRLLHALARHVAGDRDVLAGLADLVDFVDVEDAPLGGLDVEVGGVQQLQQQVLDVLAHVAGLGQRRGVADGEWHVEDAGQSLSQQRLAGAGRTDQQDVRFVDLDLGITEWNDPAITAFNPSLPIPADKIVVLHRADSSGDTFIFSSYLSAADPNGWGANIGYGTSISFPSVPNSLGESGNAGMSSGCQATPGCITYIGISYEAKVAAAGLGLAELQNASGNYELPTPATVAAEAQALEAKTPPNETLSMIYDSAPGGYPIVNYEYAIIPPKEASTQEAEAVQAFLNWAIDPAKGSSSMFLNQVNFQPLPASIRVLSEKQIAQITG